MDESFFAGKKVLVTGGSGSIGSEIVRQLLERGVEVVRVLSRDETRQVALAQALGAGDRVRFLIGDVRDKDRMLRALEGIELVFHAAALKHVPVCEYNPFEAVQTNVVGTQNVVTAARQMGVKRLVAISTDKAVSPANTMGATKLLAERLIAAAQASMAGIRLCAVRFGNVLGSRGSLLPSIKEQIRTERRVSVTDRSMTRFMMTIKQAVRLVLRAAELARGGEIFVVPMPKVRIVDLLAVLIEEECRPLGWDPRDIEVREIGKRPGERLHESLLTPDECERALALDGLIVVGPAAAGIRGEPPRLAVEDFGSETGPFLSHPEIAALVREALATAEDQPRWPNAGSRIGGAQLREELLEQYA